MNIIPKIHIYSPMLPCLGQNLPQILPHFCALIIPYFQHCNNRRSVSVCVKFSQWHTKVSSIRRWGDEQGKQEWGVMSKTAFLILIGGVLHLFTFIFTTGKKDCWKMAAYMKDVSLQRFLQEIVTY